MFNFDRSETMLVIGLGKSGLASVEVLRARGVTIYATDEKPVDQLSEQIAFVQSAGGTFVEPNALDRVLARLSSAVLSPGVPPTSPVVRRVQDANVAVVGEVEVAYRLCKAPIVAVTGTKGKSTTTALIGHLLRACGLNVRVGGNIGNPLIKEVLDVDAQSWVVAEVSSFQLETIRSFKPRVSVLLNIAPDHLDRYYSMDEYAEAKYRIFANQAMNDWFVGNLDDPRVAELHWKQGETRVQARQLWFTLRSERRAGDDALARRRARLRAGDRRSAPDRRDRPRDEIPLAGEHNVQNVMAALLAALAIGCDPEALREGVKTFRAMPHRLEPVAEIDGVLYVDDSKSTNPGSVIAALNAFDRPIVLIAGGRAKGTDFGEMGEAIRDRAKAVVAIGEAAEAIAAESGGVTVLRAESMEEAVERARASRRQRRRRAALAGLRVVRHVPLGRRSRRALRRRPSTACGSTPVRNARPSGARPSRADRAPVAFVRRGAARYDALRVGGDAGRDRARHGVLRVERDRVRGLTTTSPTTSNASSSGWSSGSIAAFFAYRIDYQKLKKPAPYILLAAVVALRARLRPARRARRQRRPPLDRRHRRSQLQPSEFAKLALVVYLAAMLATRGERITSLAKGSFPLCVPVCIWRSSILKEPDMGTASLLVFTAFAMFFAAGARISHLFAIAMRDRPFAALTVLASPYKRARVFAFWTRGRTRRTPASTSCSRCSRSAAAASSASGSARRARSSSTCPNSTPTSSSRSSARNSACSARSRWSRCSWYSRIARSRSRIAAPDRFGYFLVIGCAAIVVIQAFINIGVVTSSWPVTGVPLPFISFGGSSLIVNLIAVALIANVGRYRRVDPQKP